MIHLSQLNVTVSHFKANQTKIRQFVRSCDNNYIPPQTQRKHFTGLENKSLPSSGCLITMQVNDTNADYKCVRQSMLMYKKLLTCIPSCYCLIWSA